MRKLPPNPLRAFTLPELAVAAAIFGIVSIILFAAANTALKLYVKNFSINESHGRARAMSENLVNKIHQAVEPPDLLDGKGAPVTGSGPASGISCLLYASNKPYYTSNAINLNTKTIQVNQIEADQPMPKKGDYVHMPQIKDSKKSNGFVSSSFFAQIVDAAPSGSNNVKLTFANDVGTYFDPPPKGITVVNPDQPFYLMSRSAFIAVTSNGTATLRYYPAIKTVSADGQSAFDNKDNFKEISDLEPLENQTEGFPFSYTDSARRYLNVHLRASSKRYDKRAGNSYNTFESLKTVVAYRSATHKTPQPK